MKWTGATISIFTVLIAACKSTQELPQPLWVDPMLKELEPKTILSESTFAGTYWIAAGDTTQIQDFEFQLKTDTLTLSEAFQKVVIPEVLIAKGIGGRSFLQVRLYSDSTFSKTKVVRGIGRDYREVQKQIDTILSGFRMAAPPKDSATVIFSHTIRLDID